MSQQSDPLTNITFHPLALDRWEDLEKLFGPRGAVGGCWCMWFRIKRSQYEQQKGEGNKQALKDMVASGQVPGILAYVDGDPVGWCSLGPRENYSVLSRSRILKRVDDNPVWSVVCFFIAKQYRRKGMGHLLLRAAIGYAQENGTRILEGYPVEPKKKEMPTVFAHTGFAAIFRDVGFVEVARRSETRPIMRYDIEW